MIEEDVELAKNGDQRAFERIYNDNYNRLFGLLFKFTKDREEAEDLTQETFLKAWVKLGLFKGESSFSTWLCRVGINIALKSMKKHNNRPPLKDIDIHSSEEDEIDNLLNHAETPEAMAMVEEQSEIVGQTFDSMNPVVLQCYLLRENQMLTYQQISETMGVPVGTVRSRIHRAKQFVRDSLEEGDG